MSTDKVLQNHTPSAQADGSLNSCSIVARAVHTMQDMSGNFQELPAKSNAHRYVALYIPFTVLFWFTLCCFKYALAFVGRFSPGIQRSFQPGLCLCAPSSIALSAPKQCLLCLVSLMPQPRERSEYWFYIAIVKMHRISRRLDMLRPPHLRLNVIIGNARCSS